MLSKTPKMPPNCHLRSYHHLSTDFSSISHRFWTIFGPIFGRFWTIFGMHFCIQFSHRFWTGLGMNFLSEVQMFHNAETLRKLFSPQFLQCFVNVALFRTRTEIIDNLLWNAKKQASKFDGESIKNRSKNVFFESFESDRVSDSILGAFWHHFGRS